MSKVQDTLFSGQSDDMLRRVAPLAERMRPRTLDEYIGQEAIVQPGAAVRQAIDRDEPFSMILWGPPGSGKTTLARVIAASTSSAFVALSGVTSSKEDLRQAIEQADERLQLHRQRTIVFIDEIHRWNKAQQDALLPVVESGRMILIGATTENPSFEVIAPLLSRCRVVVLERLSPEALSQILDQALADQERGLGGTSITLQPAARDVLLRAANGDARTALNGLELAVRIAPVSKPMVITPELMSEALQRPMLRYDRQGEEHYNVVSAFIKSMRGSNPDGALYWLGRMVEAGEDPLFIARRMIIFASEDISVADARALPLAVACFQACQAVGLPECAINLSHVTVYLATAPKSNATYVAYGRAMDDVRQSLNEPVPLHLRNAPTKLMKGLGYGKDYKYSHDFTPADGQQSYRPPTVENHVYYQSDNHEPV